MGFDHRIQKILSFLAVGAMLLLFFQNCKAPEGTDHSSTSKSSGIEFQGNGEGYSGKAYVAYDFSGACGNTDERSVIEIIEGKSYLTKDNCADITPRLISNEVVKPHNINIALNTQVMYQDLDIPGITVVFCRGEGVDAENGKDLIGDFFVQNVRGAAFGYFKLGVYQNGVLENTFTEENVRMMIGPQPDGTIRYLATQNGGNQAFALQLDPQTMKGKLLTAPRFIGDPLGKNELQEMDCYEHR